MYKIEKADYGFRITASGDMDLFESERLTLDLLDTLSAHDRQFSLLIDIRRLTPFAPEVLPNILKTHVMCKRMSMRRAAIIIDSPELRSQGKYISSSVKSASGDRFIVASEVENWEKKALDWVMNSIEPN